MEQGDTSGISTLYVWGLTERGRFIASRYATRQSPEFSKSAMNTLGSNAQWRLSVQIPAEDGTCEISPTVIRSDWSVVYPSLPRFSHSQTINRD
jgi:hypothetical protein